MVDQRELTGERLAAEVLSLARNREARLRMGDAARNVARPDAARTIADQALALIGRAPTATD
jgi:UDP-N-acetylglucosamine:LPS N-acetylglucosamine transferase